MRALAVVNCHRTSTIRSFRSSSQAVTCFSNSSLVSIRRSGHCRASTDSSISAMFSQLPCFGVWWTSSRSAIRRACSGGNASHDDLILWLADKEARALIHFEAATTAPEGPGRK